MCRANCVADQVANFRISVELLDSQFQINNDGGQQVIEIVRDATRELTDGLHLFGMKNNRISAVSFRQIMNIADINRFIPSLDFTDRQMHRKLRAVLTLADNLAPDTNNFCLTGMAISRHITIVQRRVAIRHQHGH